MTRPFDSWMLPAIFLSWTSTCAAATITVDWRGGADFLEIQPAIDAALDGDTVLVKPGTYVVRKPIDFNHLHSPYNPASPPVKNIVVRAEAGPSETTIQMSSDPEDRARASVVVFEKGESDASVLDGFTLTGGTGTTWLQAKSGGGVLIRLDSSPTLIRCAISGNTGLYGGGAWIYKSAPTLVDCRISGNAAITQEAGGSGGGIYVSNGAPSLIRCTISDNRANIEGGGMHCSAASSPALTRCTISGNNANYKSGGGIYCENSSPVLVGCAIFENRAGGQGGGVICKETSTPSFADCTIERNMANASETGNGGGLAFQESSSSLEGCTIRQNRARINGAGIWCESCPRLELRDCRISGNWATRSGGGLSCRNTSPVLMNCIVSGNLGRYGGSAAFAENSSSPALVDCTISGNWCTKSYPVIDTDVGSVLHLTGCILWGNSGLTLDGLKGIQAESSCLESGFPWPGPGNTNLNPSFFAEGSFDFTAKRIIAIDGHDCEIPDFAVEEPNFHLRKGSPIIDLGTCVDDPAVDLDGNPRPLGAGCDMGVYEYTDPVDFPDAGLAGAVREALGIPSGQPILVSDLMQLKSLDARERGIRDLAGLEHARNLEEILLDGNQISLLGPIAGLRSLQRLSLLGNPLRPWAASVDLARIFTNNPDIRVEWDRLADENSPWILEASPIQQPNTPPDRIRIVFSEAVDPAGAGQPGNFALLDSSGKPRTVDAAVCASGERTAVLHVNGGVPLADGEYILEIRSPVGPDDPAGIRDAAGNPLDGNGDGIGGDGATLAIIVDSTGPHVVAFLPGEPQPGPVQEIILEFDEPVAAAPPAGALTIREVRIAGPEGDIALSSIFPLEAGRGLYAVTFPTQSREGVYRVTAGPGIADLRGNRMDQDRDGLSGAGDAYEGSFVIRGPRVVRFSPDGGVKGPVESIRFVFDEDIDPASFDPGQDLVEFLGPSGPIVPSGFAWIDARNLTITFQPVAEPGPCKVILGPDILNRAGNPMDMDGDFVDGETPDDFSAAAFQILREPVGLGGAIETDRTLPAGEFCHADGRITVAPGATLRFEPGCTVKFDKGLRLEVLAGGKLEVMGTPDRPVIFTSWQDDRVEGDTNGDRDATAPAAEDWEGILLSGEGAEAVIDHAAIRYAERGIHADAGKVRLQGVVLQWNRYGVYIHEPLAESLIENCLVAENDATGLFLRADSRHTVRNSTIAWNGWKGEEPLQRAGVHIGAATVAMSNTILAFNRIGLGHDGDRPLVDVSFCDFFNPGGTEIRWGPDPGKPEIWKNGNISADPLFATGGENPYELLPGSPAIDAGTGEGAPVSDLLGRPRYDDPGAANLGPVDPTYADLGAYEWQGESRRADLLVANVSIDRDGASPGALFVASWTVTNIGQEPAPGPWTDAVFLSQDRSVDIRDLKIAEISNDDLLPSHGDLEPGESYRMERILQVPPSAGAFNILVLADSGGKVFESDEANNLREAPGCLSVEVPVLAVDVPREGTVRKAGWTYYRFEAPPEKSFRIRLQPRSHQGTMALYIRCGSAPTLESYDAVSAIRRMDQEIPIIAPCDGPIFVGIYGQSLSADERAFSIGIQETALSIHTVTPARICASSPATLLIEGEAFRPGAQVRLVSPEGEDIEGDEVSANSVAISATFDLRGTGVPPGIYGVKVANPGEEPVVLAGAITIEEEPAVGLTARLIIPERARPNRKIQAVVEYKNTGNVDIPTPLFTIETGARFTWRPLMSRGNMNIADELRQRGAICYPVEHLDGSGPDCFYPSGSSQSGEAGWLPSDRYSFLAQGDAPPTVLRPGESGSAAIHLKTPMGEGEIPFRLYASVPGLTGEEGAIDWARIASDLRPQGIPDDSWTAFLARLRAQIGETWSEFHAMLRDNAEYLAELGLRIQDERELLAFELIQAECMGEPHCLEKVQDAFCPSPSLPLSFERYFLPSPSYRARTGVLGRGWTHCYEISLRTNPDGSLILHDASGIEILFLSDGRGGYSAPPGIYADLSAEDGGGHLLQRKDGLAIRFRPDGRFDSIADPRGNQVTARYDGQGNLEEVSHSSGDRFLFSHEGGRLASLTDHAGRTIRYRYDASMEHLTSVQAPDRDAVTYEYRTGTGPLTDHNLLAIDHSGGRKISFQYDELGRLAGHRVSENDERVRYEHSSSGKTVIEDALGKKTTLWMDSRGSIARVQDPTGRTVELEYDPTGKPKTIIGPTGNRSEFTFNSRGSIKSFRSPQGNETTFGYGGAFQGLRWVADPRGNRTRRDYDDSGSLTAIDYADGSREELPRGEKGVLEAWINRRGHRIEIDVNGRGQVTSKKYLDGTKVIYTYDAQGRLKSFADRRGTTAIDYDPESGLPARISHPGGRSLEFRYDPEGRRTRMTDSDGFAVGYRYDEAGRLEAIADGQDRPIESYTYDPVGRLGRKDRGNGTSTTYRYDDAGRILEVVNRAPDGSVNSGFEYGYDTRGFRKSMTITLRSKIQGTWNFEYDAGGQLRQASFTSKNPAVADQTLTYEYDRVGNRLRTVSNGTPAEYTTDEVDRYQAVGPDGMGYDPDGNLISWSRGNDRWSYSYDDENRLLRVERRNEGGELVESWSYEYDGLGNRIASTAGGRRTQYLVDPFGLGNVVAEYDGAGSLVARYVHGLGLCARSSPSGERAYYGFDAVGNTAELSGSDGSVLNTYLYSPFGEKLHEVEAVPNPFGFVGQYGVLEDGHGGLHMRAREYFPELGRFGSVDPLRLETHESYQYAANNPVHFTDPKGLQVATADNGFLGTFLIPGLVAGATVSGGADISNGQIGTTATVSVGIGGGFAWRPGATVYFVDDIENLGGNSWSVWIPFFIVHWDPKGQRITSLSFYFGLALALTYDETIMNPEQKLIGLYRLLLSSSHTPEDKFGPAGYDPPDTAGGAERRFLAEGGSFTYRIEFWNKPTAAVPTQDAVIVDRLDPGLDWSTFSFTNFGFLKWDVDLPGGQSIDTRVDLRPDMDIAVEVRAAFDPETGEARWWFHCIDPLTGDYPDTFEGFLPPFNEKTQYEIGWVEFAVRAKDGLPSGAEIRNQAFVEFDFAGDIADHPAPKEGPFVNTIDAGPPSSRVDPLPRSTAATRFLIALSGSDDEGGSGIAGFDIYVAVDGGAPALWKSTAEAAEEFEGDPGRCYGFFSVAWDNVGHREALPAEPDTVTCILFAGENPFRRGDVNADSKHDLTDAINVLSYLFLGGEAPACLKTADCDDSGIVDITDVITLLGYLYLGGRAPEAPFPGCGLDPTADGLGCGSSPCLE